VHLFRHARDRPKVEARVSTPFCGTIERRGCPRERGHDGREIRRAGD
jgi:hypothetical protein